MRMLRRLRAYARAFRRARPDSGTTEAIGSLARRPALLLATTGYELATLVSNRVDVRVKYLAVMKTSSLTGCPFCLDLGSAVSQTLGIDAATLADLHRYADSDRFTAVEKAALDLTVAMTSTPADVDGELRARLLAQLTPGQYAELASAIAWENHRARLNRALGADATGISRGAFCLLPERPAGDPPAPARHP